MNKSLKFGGNKVMKKIVLVNVITIVILVAIGLVGFHYYSEATDYVKTENAKVDGEQIKIASPVSGNLTSFDAKEGKTYDKGDKIGEVAGKGEDGQSQEMDIKAPSKTNIDDTDVEDVEKGQAVDVYIDGQEASVKGKVSQVGLATASSFSLMRSSNSNGNYTKVTQVVPVKITFDFKPSTNVVPGMNVEVRIHKN
uniref:p-hydroxybenzoic acid efflux pump subunit AaeA-like beta-barrel domain-containing protein n=1 Tax=Acyrthosiphon pisum TaxID=7029 RepID=A0A8R2H8J3_ACYPI|eukprot:XP_016664774.1 PREDICTED: putative efflux system component YhbJ [Acyrthosiphon pisum]